MKPNGKILTMKTTKTILVLRSKHSAWSIYLTYPIAFLSKQSFVSGIKKKSKEKKKSLQRRSRLFQLGRKVPRRMHPSRPASRQQKHPIWTWCPSFAIATLSKLMTLLSFPTLAPLPKHTRNWKVSPEWQPVSLEAQVLLQVNRYQPITSTKLWKIIPTKSLISHTHLLETIYLGIFQFFYHIWYRVIILLLNLCWLITIFSHSLACSVINTCPQLIFFNLVN